MRAISLDDAKSLFSYRSDSKANMFQGWIPKSLDDAVVFIKKTASDFNMADTWFQFVIIEKDSKNIIGDIGVHFIDENMQVELGITLRASSQGNGYANEALKTVINHLFFDLKKHRITTSIDPKNHSSIKMIEQLGFRKEAHLLESLYLNDTWVDEYYYSILNREWNN